MSTKMDQVRALVEVSRISNNYGSAYQPKIQMEDMFICIPFMGVGNVFLQHVAVGLNEDVSSEIWPPTSSRQGCIHITLSYEEMADLINNSDIKVSDH